MKLDRSAGILMHVTSLPSPFGIGDLGSEAQLFADFLQRSNQTYWQILPLNPTEQGQGNSPYSAVSSRAGNTLLISPELLAADGWLPQLDLSKYYLPKADKADYKNAEKVKEQLFEIAWATFQNSKDSGQQSAFEAFCVKENAWLLDFAFYTLLKDIHDGKPWFEWESGYKNREENLLSKLEISHAQELQKTKWLQFVFSIQWQKLKKYCNGKGISFFGDLPFYTSYDSVDVWSNRTLFKLDNDGQAIGVAGVPPDAFSSDGQLWGMPVFVWEIHKQQNYSWWIDRLKKNMEHFDLLRLDHFRAFADYWEVPAAAETAKSGEWKIGPKSDFFNAVKNALPTLPFIAEDLGDIDEPVYELRDEFQFAGMKVLQFAFGHEMPLSPHIPHNFTKNFVVYTGTHDNNTILGWYRHEAINHHHQLNHYTGQQIDETNIHHIMCRMAYASVADIAILPVQDVLGLDENARMNIPASPDNNWLWRLLPDQLNHGIENMLSDWTWLYNRRTSEQ